MEKEKIERFLTWLRENGASFPKVDWPRNDTPSGIRGAIALDDIQTNEPILSIPYRLMLAPPQILVDPVMGPIFDECTDILRGDFMLTAYLMHEMRLGTESFYHPFIDILPFPECTSEWTDDELLELQVSFDLLTIQWYR
jgi:hypothetical protein